jgi:DNA-binding MltR family transcriptional regulator
MYEIIKKWSINQSMLADKMQMSKGNFKNKLNPNQTAYKFTDSESEKLNGILIELAKDITDLEDPFNNALKSLVQKEI